MGPLAAMIPLITTAVGAAGTVASTINAFRKPKTASMPTLAAPTTKDKVGPITQTRFSNGTLGDDSSSRSSLLGGS